MCWPCLLNAVRTVLAVCPADERHPELMFRHPENEYDWLSSDAAVDEVLLINEYTFTEAGLRAG